MDNGTVIPRRNHAQGNVLSKEAGIQRYHAPVGWTGKRYEKTVYRRAGGAVGKLQGVFQFVGNSGEWGMFYTGNGTGNTADGGSLSDWEG